jgi:hypothetical protein
MSGRRGRQSEPSFFYTVPGLVLVCAGVIGGAMAFVGLAVFGLVTLLSRPMTQAPADPFAGPTSDPPRIPGLPRVPPRSEPVVSQFARDADPFRRIRWAVDHARYVETDRYGLNFHQQFRDVPAAGLLLVGLETHHDTNGTIHGVRGLWRDAGGAITAGELHGKTMATARRTEAQTGYALGSLQLWNEGFITQGIRARMCRIRNDHLDPADAYDAEWLGNPKTGPGVLDGKGRPLVGIGGNVDTNTRSLLSISLVAAADGD